MFEMTYTRRANAEWTGDEDGAVLWDGPTGRVYGEFFELEDGGYGGRCFLPWWRYISLRLFVKHPPIFEARYGCRVAVDVTQCGFLDEMMMMIECVSWKRPF